MRDSEGDQGVGLGNEPLAFSLYSPSNSANVTPSSVSRRADSP